MIFDLIQLISGLIICYSYIPQILKIHRTKSVGDVSIAMYILYTVGCLLFQIYVIHLIIVFGTGFTILFTNSLSLLLSIIMVYLIKKYK